MTEQDRPQEHRREIQEYLTALSQELEKLFRTVKLGETPLDHILSAKVRTHLGLREKLLPPHLGAPLNEAMQKFLQQSERMSQDDMIDWLYKTFPPDPKRYKPMPRAKKNEPASEDFIEALMDHQTSKLIAALVAPEADSNLFPNIELGRVIESTDKALADLFSKDQARVDAAAKTLCPETYIEFSQDGLETTASMVFAWLIGGVTGIAMLVMISRAIPLYEVSKYLTWLPCTLIGLRLGKSIQKKSIGGGLSAAGRILYTRWIIASIGILVGFVLLEAFLQFLIEEYSTLKNLFLIAIFHVIGFILLVKWLSPSRFKNLSMHDTLVLCAAILARKSGVTIGQLCRLADTPYIDSNRDAMSLGHICLSADPIFEHRIRDEELRDGEVQKSIAALKEAGLIEPAGSFQTYMPTRRALANYSIYLNRPLLDSIEALHKALKKNEVVESKYA